MIKIAANKHSYDSKNKRNKKDVKYIVIHNTGNRGDTAENNANYFKNVNTREAGAHFFIDQNGVIIKSVDLNRVAWAVGGGKYADCNKTGGGKLYRIACNANSVSIELCDIMNKQPSDKMIKSVAETVKYIQKYCPNAKDIIRHFDVNGKHCPERMMEDEDWKEFQFKVLKEYLKK